MSNLNTRLVMGRIFDLSRFFDLLSHELSRIFTNTQKHILKHYKFGEIATHLNKTWDFFFFKYLLKL